MEISEEIILLVTILVVGLIIRLIPHIKYYFPATQDSFFFLNKFKNPDYRTKVLSHAVFDFAQ